MSTATNGTTMVAAKDSSLPEPVTRRGIDEPQWRTLMGSLFPGAKAESVLMVVDYCKARKLDPMKKPCHIVPMKVKDAKTGEWVWRDVVMPGIYEYRTTAMRTGKYLGHSKPEYGPMADAFGVTAPEWCEMTIYRQAGAGERIEFPVRVYFRECCATKYDKESKTTVANDRWSKAPIQMLQKCTEAAGLREAFPDEFGGEPTAEEMEGQFQSAVIEAKPVVQQPKRLSETAADPEPETTDDEATKAAEPAATLPTIVSGALMNKGPKQYWVIKTSDGKTYYTRATDVALACEHLQHAGTPVEMVARTVSGQLHLDEVIPQGAAS